MLNSTQREESLQTTAHGKGFIILIFLLTIVVVSSMDIYVPISPQLAIFFGTSENLMKLTFVIGPMASVLVAVLAGYFSDRYGRRPVFMGSLLLYCLGTFLCALAPSFGLFFLGRAVQSLGTGSLLVLNHAILSDLYRGVNLAKILGLYALFFPLTFALAPLAGAQVFAWFGWRMIFLLLLSIAIPLSFLLNILLPETCERKELTCIFHSLRKLAASKLMLSLALANALPIAIGMLFTINGAFIYQTVYAFDAVAFSYVQAIPVAVQYAGTLLYRHVVSLAGLKGSLWIGHIFAGIYSFGCLLIVLELIEGPWISVMAVSLFTFGGSFMITTSGTLLLDHSRDGNGLAASFLSLVRNLVIIFVSLGAGFLPHDSAIPTFAAMFAIASGICVLIPLVQKQLSASQQTLAPNQS